MRNARARFRTYFLNHAQNTLQEEGFENDAALDGAIKKLEADLKKARKKEADGDDMDVSNYFCLNLK